MSSEIVRKVIEDFLITPTPEALAIKGKWGTGKTYTWDKILKKANSNNGIALNKYAYISLFGINSLDSLKLAIFEQTINRALIKDGVSLKTLKSNTDAVATSLGRKSFSFFESVPWVKDFAPILQSASFLSVSKTLICFDDLERKGDSLSAKEIMGLISLLKESKDCKIVVIFSDSAFDKGSEEEYQTYREKVIDIELAFVPTSRECASLIFKDNDIVSLKLKECSEKLNITNLRILKKIKKITNSVCNLLSRYENEVIEQACHTLSLYAFCYYYKDPSIPKYDFVKSLNNIYLNFDDKKNISDREKSWNSMLREYGYNNTDEFDLVLAEVVENGFIHEQNLHEESVKLNEKIIKGKGGNSFRDAWSLYHDSFDNNEEEFVRNLNEKARFNARYISPSDLNATVKIFRELDKNDLADDLIEFYISKNKDRTNLFDLNSYSFRGNIDDPKIISRFDTVYIEVKEIRSLKSVLDKMVEKNGWNPEDEIILSGATPGEYYDLFKSESGGKLLLYAEAALRFGRFDNSTERQKQIELNAIEALKKIAAESKLNALRVKGLGIKIENEA